LTCILIDPNKTGKSSEALRLELEKHNIESRPLWKPMHLQPVFKSCPAYINGTSEKLFKNGLCLPSGSNMTDDERLRVYDCIVRFLLN
jgi:dTDP-4-amino-4,6-dideoxygalactose transaminase